MGTFLDYFCVYQRVAAWGLVGIVVLLWQTITLWRRNRRLRAFVRERAWQTCPSCGYTAARKPARPVWELGKG